MSAACQRVQIVIKGQRFESTVDSLKKECTFFEGFFTTAEGSNFEQPSKGANGEAVDCTIEAPTESSPLWLFRFPNAEPEFMGALLVFLRRGKKTFIFKEMSTEQQSSMASLVQLFGISRLMEECGSVSVSAVSDPERAGKWGELQRGGEVERAMDYAEKLKALEGAQMPTEARDPHPSIDDDELMMPTSGCTMCGVSGHNDADCPHKPKSS